MLFQTEKELVTQFSELGKKFLKTLGRRCNKYALLKEFESGHGIADIVIGTVRPSFRLPSREPLPPKWVYPLTKLEVGSNISLHDFCCRLGVSSATARKYLKSYEVAGFLKNISPGVFEMIANYQHVAEEVIAIEAKLHDWKGGLHQACRYRRFAHSSFVLMDEDCIGPALKNITAFEAKSVGLLSLNVAGKIKIHYLPSIGQRTENSIFFQVQEALFNQIKSAAS